MELVVYILDDLIVTGSNDEEHFRNLESVLNRLDSIRCGVEEVIVCVYEAFSGVFRICGGSTRN